MDEQVKKKLCTFIRLNGIDKMCTYTRGNSKINANFNASIIFSKEEISWIYPFVFCKINAM